MTKDQVPGHATGPQSLEVPGKNQENPHGNRKQNLLKTAKTILLPSDDIRRQAIFWHRVPATNPFPGVGDTCSLLGSSLPSFPPELAAGLLLRTREDGYRPLRRC